MDLDELYKQMELLQSQKNNTPVANFEGYSPKEMYCLLYSDTFDKESPIQFQQISEEDCRQIPLFNQMNYLLTIIAESGELKLTSRDYLPPKIVKDVYAQGFLKEYMIESGLVKLTKEMDCPDIHISRILLELTGLIKKRTGKLSITKKGEKLLNKHFELLKLIFETYTSKFNWAYSYGWGMNQDEYDKIGQLGYRFSLILLSKYGKERQLDEFYADKYFKAFPHFLISKNEEFRYAKSYYSHKTFERFLTYFGLITIEKEGKGLDEKMYVQKTELFDKLIHCEKK